MAGVSTAAGFTCAGHQPQTLLAHTLCLALASRACFPISAHGTARHHGGTLTLQIWYRISPRPDFVDIEIAMNEGAMPPMVRTPGVREN